jgi:hypothetical protein
MVIGLGYYSIRVTQTMVQEMREKDNTGDRRPLITVSEDGTGNGQVKQGM